MKALFVTASILTSAIITPALADRLVLSVQQAYAIIRDGEPVVDIVLDETSAREFEAFTRERVGRPIETYLDDELLFTVTIREPILDGASSVTNIGSAEDAINLSTLLRAGEVTISVADPE